LIGKSKTPFLFKVTEPNRTHPACARILVLRGPAAHGRPSSLLTLNKLFLLDQERFKV